jgi:hypothetical protein
MDILQREFPLANGVELREAVTRYADTADQGRTWLRRLMSGRSAADDAGERRAPRSRQRHGSPAGGRTRTPAGGVGRHSPARRRGRTAYSPRGGGGASPARRAAGSPLPRALSPRQRVSPRQAAGTRAASSTSPRRGAEWDRIEREVGTELDRTAATLDALHRAGFVSSPPLQRGQGRRGQRRSTDRSHSDGSDSPRPRQLRHSSAGGADRGADEDSPAFSLERPSRRGGLFLEPAESPDHRWRMRNTSDDHSRESRRDSVSPAFGSSSLRNRPVSEQTDMGVPRNQEDATLKLKERMQAAEDRRIRALAEKRGGSPYSPSGSPSGRHSWGRPVYSPSPQEK